jgi:hypothetical protein
MTIEMNLYTTWAVDRNRAAAWQAGRRIDPWWQTTAQVRSVYSVKSVHGVSAPPLFRRLPRWAGVGIIKRVAQLAPGTA